MKKASEQRLLSSRSPALQRGRARGVLLFLVAFVSGMAIGGVAVHRTISRSAASTGENATQSQLVTTANEPAVNPAPSAGSKATSAVVWQPTTDAVAIEDVKRALPNITSISAEEGTRILREAAFKEFAAKAQELQVQVSEAQQRLANAQTGATQAEQQAAMKHLQDVQEKQTAELKILAERSQARIAAFQQLKNGKP